MAQESRLLGDVYKSQDEAGRLMLTAGKCVSPRFFVSMSQPVSLGSTAQTGSSGGTEVTMEYEIVRSLLISLLIRGTVLRVTLRWALSR